MKQGQIAALFVFSNSQVLYNTRGKFLLIITPGIIANR